MDRTTSRSLEYGEFQAHWCQGAARIGMSRCDLSDRLRDARVEEEIEIAVDPTLRDGFRGGHAICHGSFGNLDLLRAAGRDEERVRISGELVAEISEYGVGVGLDAGSGALGLMPGVAGIGYQLLRMGVSEFVPSVLMLEFPGPR